MSTVKEYSVQEKLMNKNSNKLYNIMSIYIIRQIGLKFKKLTFLIMYYYVKSF